MRKLHLKFIAIIVLTMFVNCHLFAQADDGVSISPNKGWEDPSSRIESDEYNTTNRPWWSIALMWFPNRVLDLFDTFRFDIGVGEAVGAVGRFSKGAQIGYRRIFSSSARAGFFGRKEPYLIETTSEYGAGPSFVQSKERVVCPAEFGIGLDVIVGAYGGVCFDELIDFAAGVFLVDFKGDDL